MVNEYGVNETNPLGKNGHDFENDPIVGTVDWTDERLARIERLRFISDPGFPLWDLSYCHGRLKDGRRVNVSLPFSQLARTHRTMTAEGSRLVRKPSISNQIVAFAKKDGVFAKGLGIFDAISTLC